VRATPVRQLFAAGSSTVAASLRGEVRPAVVLGAFPSAMYLRLVGGEVIAVLTRDAVPLPLGLRLRANSADEPLDRWTGPVRVGSSYVQTANQRVRLSRVIPVSAPTNINPEPRAVAHAWRRLPALGWVEPLPELLDILTGDRLVGDVVDRFLGVGPGLTPAGDDILAGFFVGSWAFDVVDDPLRSAVLEAARAGTTDLSAALLRCASRGESIPPVHALLWALSKSTRSDRTLDEALLELTHVGHTSGAALAVGIVAAAQVAARVRGHSQATTASPRRSRTA